MKSKNKHSVVVDSSRQMTRASARLPKDRERLTTLYGRVSEETGFVKRDIRIVVRCFFREVAKSILAKKAVIIPEIGFFYSTITMRRVVMDFKKTMPAKRTMMLPRWVFRCKPSAPLYEALGELDFTQEEFEKIVYKPIDKK